VVAGTVPEGIFHHNHLPCSRGVVKLGACFPNGVGSPLPPARGPNTRRPRLPHEEGNPRRTRQCARGPVESNRLTPKMTLKQTFSKKCGNVAISVAPFPARTGVASATTCARLIYAVPYRRNRDIHGLAVLRKVRSLLRMGTVKFGTKKPEADGRAAGVTHSRQLGSDE